MDFWDHRAVQDKCDLADLKAGRVRDDEDPPQEMDRTRLSPRQMAALKAFHSGASLKDTAKAAGVSRQTLHRWRTIYHSFSRAMEVWEEGQMIIARSRLVDMANNAVDALAQTIEDGNARAAMMVLRSLQILRTYAPLKPPAEGAAREPRHAGMPLPQDSKTPAGQDRAAAGQSAAREQEDSGAPACRDRAGAGTGEQVREAGDTGWKPVVRGEAGTAAPNSGKVAPAQHIPEKTPPAAALAQHINGISNPPVQRPKTAILAGKAGLAIKNACYNALQELTGSYGMLHATRG